MKPRPLPIARSPLKRSQKSIRKRSRSKAERERIYGPPGYVEWIHATPCEICGVLPSEVVHIETGGTGRKADYTKTVPFCHRHHLLLHGFGRGTFERANGCSLEHLAEQIQNRWASSVLEDTK